MGGTLAPEQASVMEKGLLHSLPEGSSHRNIEPDSNACNILASVKEQELQFERLTRELEAERQIVASQLERCRLGSESPGAASCSSSEKSYNWRSADASTPGESKTDNSRSATYRVRSGQDQAAMYSPGHASLLERNSSSSSQVNSYTDNGYPDSGSFYSSHSLVKTELRLQHSFPGIGTTSLLRSTRAEGQTLVKAIGNPGASGRVIRRVSSVPSRTQSPGRDSGASPSRGSGLSHRSPVVTEPKPLSSVFSTTTLPSSQRPGSPYTGPQTDSPTLLRRVGSRSSSGGHSSSSYQATGRADSPHPQAEEAHSQHTPPPSSPVRSSGMAAVPQHYSSALPLSPHLEMDPYSPEAYDLFDIIPPSSDSLAGQRLSYTSQHSQLGPDGRVTLSPDHHQLNKDGAFSGSFYHTPTHRAPDLDHGDTDSTLYGAVSGDFRRTSSLRGVMAYERDDYALDSTPSYADPYRLPQYEPAEPSYTQQAAAMDNAAMRSPSINSIQKDPREFAWRDPDLPEVIHMLQHQFPSVQANAAAYLQHLSFGDNGVKAEVCRLGGIQHLVDLLDHKAVEVQRNACGALRNLVYGKATDENKMAVRNAGGVLALLRLLRRTADTEVRELVTGVLWNLSSYDGVKMTIIRDALSTLSNTVIIPHSGWSSSSSDDDHKLKFHSSLVLRNTSGCLRNLSSAGEEARKQMRSCEGLVDSLLYIIKACVNTSDFDSKIVENCVCTLRNLSYRLELEITHSHLLGTQELDGLLDSESPSKLADYACWGKRRKKRLMTSQEGQWDGVGPIPGFSKAPKGVEMLWHPAVVKPYLTLLSESSNPATLEGSAGSLQNLSAGNWKFAAYIRAAVRKEKGLPILVELLRMDNDRVVCSVATALRNMALDVRNKELIGKYAMRDLVNRLPGGNNTLLSDETVAAICCTLHEVTSKNMENAKALADTGGIDKLVSISKGRGERYSMKVVKAAAQVLNTLWQYRDLRNIYKKDGWNQNHFLTPVSTLERDRYKSQPTLPTSALQMSPVNQSGGSATSSPAMLGIKEHHSDHRTPFSMQFYNYQGDNNANKTQYTGSYPSPSREEARRGELYYADETGRRNYETYGMYLQSPRAYEDSGYHDTVHLPSSSDYRDQAHTLKSNTNYVDFYSSTRRPSYRAEQYPGSPDSWV
ncbi:hypothetical protein GJAV_G00203940 [Gymnothorax javanicus]|nr:hypothetical protein GJAV_G00203940 [Gymnothorax javanicus]